jgi:hypothetical protein
MRTRGWILALAAVCLVLLSAGVAYAQSQSANQDAGSPLRSGAGAKILRAFFSWTVRGDIVVKEKESPDGLATVSFTRGEVTSADNGQVAIKEADNETQMFTLDSGTKVRVDGRQGSVSDLKPGMQAVAFTKQITGRSTELRGIGAKTSPSGG